MFVGKCINQKIKCSYDYFVSLIVIAEGGAADCLKASDGEGGCVVVKRMLGSNSEEIMAVKTKDGWREVLLGKIVEKKTEMKSLNHHKMSNNKQLKGELEKENTRRKDQSYNSREYHKTSSPRLPSNVINTTGPKWFPNMVRIVFSQSQINDDDGYVLFFMSTAADGGTQQTKLGKDGWNKQYKLCLLQRGRRTNL